METLDITPKTAIEQKTMAEQKQKRFAVGKYRKGLKLYAADFVRMQIYEVEIRDREGVTYGKKQSKKTADINPSHPHVWALNIKNAKRKFGVG